MRTYYGVYGKNGGGIYNDWAKVEKSKPFVDGFKVKKFHRFKEAELFVCNGLCRDYNVLAGLYNASLTDKGMNYFVRLNDIKNWSPEEQECDEMLNQIINKEIQEMRDMEARRAQEEEYLDMIADSKSFFSK